MALLGSVYALLPSLAVVGFLAFTVWQLMQADRSPRARPDPQLWLFPAALSLLFAGWSFHAVVAGGRDGFWTEHVRNAWGNQIWFDLLLAIAISWTLILPRARALKMQAGWWLLFIICTGCVGLLAMLARCLFLETRAPGSASGPTRLP